MKDKKHVAVIDIGKTNAKLVLVDMFDLREVAVLSQPNPVLPGPPYPHYDTDSLWQFIVGSLKDLQRDLGVDAITITTHGASGALLDGEGGLATPVLDYEYDGPDEIKGEYEVVRPGFAETGSPRLPGGLNLGAQLFWQFRTFPEIRSRTRTIVTYPQYWGWRLTGVAVNEVTSLGCHTDLWCPQERRFSSMVEHEGWLSLMAPLRKASDILGPIKGSIAEQTGLDPATAVYCGLHDSNASLVPHLVFRKAPFSVVSTGTWVISMAIGGRRVPLDPGRDLLINVNAFGDPVPSARFMGGREFERLSEGILPEFTEEDVEEVLQRGAMLLPAVEMRSGPFQGRQMRWTVELSSLTDGQRFVAISFYLALMTSVGLELAGAEGSTVIEGPFVANQAYLEMLAAATGRAVCGVVGTGTSIGASLLTAADSIKPSNDETWVDQFHSAMEPYSRNWHARASE
ncbi:MAG: FGGY-family carbohydrate kinase [Stappiaceae bacterium]